MLYSALKEKQRKAYRVKTYDDILLGSLVPMFVYDGGPDSLFKEFIEHYLLLDGHCAIFKHEGKYIVSHVNFGGMPYPNGIGRIAICATDNGVVKEFDNWLENENVGIIFNNSIFAPDLMIGITSDFLTETDASLYNNLIYSRHYPMPVAKDGKQQKAIEDALQRMRKGEPVAILSEGAVKKDEILEKYLEKGSEIPVVNLTQVKDSDKIQYLSKFRDDLFRWFYSLNGMNSQGSSKMAQQTVAEVNQDSNASMIIPHDKLHQRLKGVERCNKIFASDEEWTELKVDFSECWQNRQAECNDEFSEEPQEEPQAEPQADEVTDNE